MAAINTPYISIVSPIYLAENLVFPLVEEIKKYVITISDNYEIILVEDGSPDNSWEKIEEVCNENNKVLGIKLSRNFGQHYAICAGIRYCRGNWIIVMDCDLQDRPDQFVKLYNKTKEGFDIILAQRKIRNDSFFKIQFSKLFYKLFSYLTETEQDPTIANFGMYNKKVIDAILEMNDYIKFFPTMVQWVGFKKTKVEVLHGKRELGKSSYNIKKLTSLALNNILSFSNKPLRLTVFFGIILSGISSIVGFIQFVKYLNGKITETGFTSLILSIWFLSGVIIFLLGILGIYLGKVFENVKNRPVYIVDRITSKNSEIANTNKTC